MVTQLLSNLLDNAAKYVPDGVSPRIVVSGHRRGTRMVVEVTDNGIGVPEEDRVLVFERFHRTEAARAGFDGTGMGLSICRTVVERHGGRIECVPAPSGQGSTFRFDLPCSEGRST
jgi:signal transduction histidine kinase